MGMNLDRAGPDDDRVGAELVGDVGEPVVANAGKEPLEERSDAFHDAAPFRPQTPTALRELEEMTS
jgi:hypothetical protein